jgi:hypothetical protein
MTAEHAENGLASHGSQARTAATGRRPVQRSECSPSPLHSPSPRSGHLSVFACHAATVTRLSTTRHTAYAVCAGAAAWSDGQSTRRLTARRPRGPRIRAGVRARTPAAGCRAHLATQSRHFLPQSRHFMRHTPSPQCTSGGASTPRDRPQRLTVRWPCALAATHAHRGSETETVVWLGDRRAASMSPRSAPIDS